MKKFKIAAFLLICFGFVGLSAQKDPFFPNNPITMGQGGSFTANAEGYNAFFYNPAGFAKKSELTLASVNVYGVMDKTLFDIAIGALQGKNVSDLLTGKSRAVDLPPELVELLGSGVQDLANYIEQANGENSTAIETVIQNMQNDPQYADLLADLDPADIAENPSQLLRAVLADPELLNSVIDTFVTELANQPGVTAPTQDFSGLGDQIVENIKAKFPSGNLNAGVSVGLGYVGHGLGVGLFAGVDAGVYTPAGSSLLSAKGVAINTLTLVGGLAFELFDGFTIGASVRPTILGYAETEVGSLISDLASGGGSFDFNSIFSNGIYKGFRLGIDVGMLWDIGPFTIGAAVKDLLPIQTDYYQYQTVEDYLANLAKLTAGTKVSGGYQVPWGKLNIGAQFHPDLGVVAKVFDPRIGVDFFDVFGFLRTADSTLLNEKLEFLDYLGIGAEIKLLSVIAVRAGLNRGALTAGLGLHLLFLDINAAVALRNLQEVGGVYSFTEIGGSVEVAIRF